MLQIIRTYREFREFLAAKRRKREPIIFRARGAGAASYVPSSPRGFENFRAALRGVGHWGRASERLDALEHALRKRHGVGLPLPRKVLQNPDGSLTLFWESVLVRCFVDGFLSTIGGVEGIRAKKVSRELLDALAFQVRIQRAS